MNPGTTETQIGEEAYKQGTIIKGLGEEPQLVRCNFVNPSAVRSSWEQFGKEAKAQFANWGAAGDSHRDPTFDAIVD